MLNIIMKKILLFITLFIVLSIGVAPSVFSFAETERSAIKLSTCDTSDDMRVQVGSVDNKNYINGGGSIMVKSIMPNVYIDVSGADVSSIGYDDAFIEFYYYISNKDHSDYYHAFVLSANPQTGIADQEKDKATDAYIWELKDFRDKFSSGWNYVCLRLKNATYRKGVYEKEEAYKHLQYLMVFDISATKPEFIHISDMMLKIQLGGFYNLQIGIDEVSLVSNPLDYGGVDGDIEFVSKQRMEGIQNRNATVYLDGVDGYDFTNVGWIILVCVAGLALVLESAFIILGIMKKKGGSSK